MGHADALSHPASRNQTVNKYLKAAEKELSSHKEKILASE